MISKTLFSSKKDDWTTPASLYEELDKEFNFNLDPCATADNAKCERYFTAEDDGLSQNWGGATVFCNPPYSDIGAWVKKCYEEGHKPNTVVVLLIPSRTDTRYYHNYILHRAEVRFIKGRLKFGDGKNSAPFPSMLVIYRGPEE